MGLNLDYVSLRAGLCLVVLASLISVGRAQVLCTNPLNIGELRVLKSMKCVDIAGHDGSGNVLTYDCDAGKDQQMIICGDGTIRNQALNYCLQPTRDGNAQVVSSPCSLLNGIPAIQRWRLGRKKEFNDGGIRQVATEIINEGSDKCLDVSGTNGRGNIGVWNCDGSDDQYYFVRSRGNEVAYGRLRNDRSDLCVDVTGGDGSGGVHISNCEDSPDQFFRFYENGEIVNEQSGLCVDVVGKDGRGNVVMYACQALPDQQWTIERAYCDGEYCSFINKKSGKCLDVRGGDGRGNIGTWDCDGVADQRFKWIAEKWETPSASWINVGCNQNGKVSQQISNTVSFARSITSTTSMEVSATIGVSVNFAFAEGTPEVTTKVSTALALAWTGSRSGTTTVEHTCDNYDNGEEFTRGCMWQLQVETKQVKSGHLLTWNPQIIKCTRSDEIPKCPPFTKCTDEDCNECIDL